MIGDSTVVAGIVIPSRNPLFLGIVTVHIAAGLVCVIAGAAAVMSEKRRGRHTDFGTVYFRSLVVVSASMAALASMRWREDYQLFLIGCASLSCAVLARRSIRGSRTRRIRLHIVWMGSSYVLLLVAFYVDNGRHLPLWRDLPEMLYWLLPIGVGGALIVWTLWRHPLARVDGTPHR